MSKRIFAATIFLMLMSAFLYSEAPWSYSVAASGHDYTWVDEDSGLYTQEQMVGLDIRGSAILNPTGFYYGTFLSFARPLIGWESEMDGEIATSIYSGYDLYAAFGFPFGFRRALPRPGTGVYIGFGPAMQALIDFDSHVWGSAGLFWEFGLEALSTRGVKLSLGARMILGWASFSTDGHDFTERPDVTTSTLYLGLSWRGTRGN